MDATHLEVDLHLLELRFAGVRLIEPQAVEKLARSIERDGQIADSDAFRTLVVMIADS